MQPVHETDKCILRFYRVLITYTCGAHILIENFRFPPRMVKLLLL